MWTMVGAPTRHDGQWFVECVCSCGRRASVRMRAGAPRSAKCKSCETKAKYASGEMQAGANLKHGHCLSTGQSPTYHSWAAMKDRCVNALNPRFANYGGRGIVVCASWQDSFEAFLADMGMKPSGTSLDRVDVNGNYEPSNCRWATRLQQDRNQRRTVLYPYDVDMLCLADIAKRIGMNTGTILSRIKLGWTLEQSVSTPIRPRAPNKIPRSRRAAAHA